MTARPISRHYDYGCTFRWIQGQSHIAVKRGYVCEGQASVVVRSPRNFDIQDRPNETPSNDRNTWIASIPVAPGNWADDRYFVNMVNNWAKQYQHLVDMNDRTGRERGY